MSHNSKNHFNNLYSIKKSIGLYQIKESRNQYSGSWRGILQGASSDGLDRASSTGSTGSPRDVDEQEPKHEPERKENFGKTDYICVGLRKAASDSHVECLSPDYRRKRGRFMVGALQRLLQTRVSGSNKVNEGKEEEQRRLLLLLLLKTEKNGKKEKKRSPFWW